MILLSNNADQTLEPNQSMTFNVVVLHTGCAEWYRNNSDAINLKANKAIYEIKFGGNVGTLTANDPVQLAIALNGSPLLETTMINTPETATTTAAPVLNYVYTETSVKTNCGCGFETVTVTNTGTNPVVIAKDPRFSVKRVA